LHVAEGYLEQIGRGLIPATWSWLPIAPRPK
jgi:hypothetical protein